jgi:predicted alternative tryptophan synthase beta-subunit
VSPAGSHKPNTAIPQAFYNREAGIKKLTIGSVLNHVLNHVLMHQSIIGE